MRTAAINPANAVAGRACDHSIRVAKGEPKYAGRAEMEESDATPDGAKFSGTATRICGARHCGQKAVPCSTTAPH